MRYAKLAFLAFLLTVLPAVTIINVLADEAPAAPPKAEEKPPVAAPQPVGPAFDQLKKLQAAGHDKLNYIVMRSYQFVGWFKTEFAVGTLDNQPVIEQTLAGSYSLDFGQDVKVEGKICYNGKFEVQSVAESITRQGQTSTVKGTRNEKVLQVEVTQGDKSLGKADIIVEGLPDPPISVYALALRYLDNPMKDDGTISILNDLGLPGFAAATTQAQGKTTMIAPDARNATCLLYTTDQSHRILIESNSGLIMRQDYLMNATTSHFLIDKPTFDNWAVNGKWAESKKALVQNMLGMLPAPAKPLPDWNAKGAEMAKHWKELADKIPADQIEGIKTFATNLPALDAKALTQEQKDALAKFGDNFIYYVMSQSLNGEDQMLKMSLRFTCIGKALQIQFPADIPQDVRDTVISMLYDEKLPLDQNAIMLLINRAWSQELQDALVDRIKTTTSDSLVQILIPMVVQKQPAWVDRLALYSLQVKATATMSAAVATLGTTVDKPLYIGLLLERWRLSPAVALSFDAFAALGKILGEKMVGTEPNAFYCKWHTAVFGTETAATPEVVKKAKELFVKLDDKDIEVRKAAKKDLVALGKAVLPLLEEQRNSDSAEVREAVKDITDQIVAPGYSDTVDFIRKNEFDRNISMFIGYLACEFPSTRASAAAKLKALTGQEFGDDIAKWYQWYETNKDKLKWNKSKNMWTTE